MCENGAERTISTNLKRLNFLFDQAVASGELLFFDSSVYQYTDRGHLFYLRLCPGLSKKESSDFSVTKHNPFLPFNSKLLIEHVASAAHVLLFNKYSLVKPHVLLITEDFKPQDKSCTKADFDAIRYFYEHYGDNFVMFYNCGPLSGASQPHRHFQFIPDEDCSIPFIGHHVACSVHDLYKSFVEQLDKIQSDSFNALFSPRWGLYMIERTAEKCNLGISINSLGFLGCMLVKRAEDLERIKACGPYSLLTEIAKK